MAHGQGPGEGQPRARQAASGRLTPGLGKTGQGQGGATRKGEHGTLRRQDQDQQTATGAQGESRCQVAYELKRETDPQIPTHSDFSTWGRISVAIFLLLPNLPIGTALRVLV